MNKNETITADIKPEPMKVEPKNDLDLINIAIQHMETNAAEFEKRMQETRHRIENAKALRSCIMNNTPINNDERDFIKGMLHAIIG